MSGSEPVWVRNRETRVTRTVLAAELALLGDAWEQISVAEAAAEHGQGREYR